jgi:DNA transposition AAA+ family ATPase
MAESREEGWMSGTVVDFSAAARARDMRWFAATGTYDAIARIFSYCAATGTTGLIVGVPGCGKTAAAKAYAAENEGAAVVITMGAATANETDALGRICDALGGGIPANRGCLSTYRRIVELLRYGRDPMRHHSPDEGLEGPGLLIVDEAHSLSPRAAEAIRDLVDEVGVGVAFIGNLNLYDRWFPDKAGERLASEQFLSRIGPRTVIDKVPPEDVHAVLAARAIKGAAELEFLMRIAAGVGHLRAVDNILLLAAHNAGDRVPKLSDLKEAAGMCGLRP